MTVLKIDVDVKMDSSLSERFLRTRRAILRSLDYHLLGYKTINTTKGIHVWIVIEEPMTPKEMCDLQFLLGDDQSRCRFNFLRNDAGVFEHFNCLFSKKHKREMRAK